MRGGHPHGFPPFAKIWAEVGGGGGGRGRGPGHHHGPWGRGGPWGHWRPPFDFGGFGGGRGRRARRGDVRAGILRLLTERSMHGYEMIRELTDRSGGAWRPSAGSIYPTLQLLQDEGLVVSEESGGKKLFTLTDSGRAEADALDSAPWEEFAAEADGAHWRDLKQAGFGVVTAAMQASQTANDEQLRRVVEALNEARSKIYRILGDEDRPQSDE